MALTEIILGGEGGAPPGDAFSPSNKPRLSAVGTADYTPPNEAGFTDITRFHGPYYQALSEARLYSRVEIPLRNVSSHLGVSVNIYVVKLITGMFFVQQKHQHLVTADDTVIGWDTLIEMPAGESWGILFGVLEGGETDHTSLFYGGFPAGYPAPHPGGRSVRLSSATDLVVGEQFGLDNTTASWRTLKLTGVNVPKGVVGKIDPPDVTFSGTTAQRPVGAPLGMSYFDTTLGYEINWNGSNWVSGSGTAV